MPERTTPDDEAILDALQENGRISQQALARRLGISRPAAARRLARLLEGGVRVVGAVHPEVQGTTAMGHLSVVTDGDPRAAAEAVSRLECTSFVSLTSGPMSLIAEIRAGSSEEFHRAIDRVRSLPGVISSDVVIYSEVLLDVLRPLRVEAAGLDAVDEAIIGLLREDGRASYTELASRCGISVGSARNRATRLLSSGVVRLGVMRELPPSDHRLRLGIGLRLRGGAAVDLRSLRIPEAQFVARAFGRHDMVVTVDGVTRDEAVTALAAAWSTPGVIAVESWIHLRVVKERY